MKKVCIFAKREEKRWVEGSGKVHPELIVLALKCDRLTLVPWLPALSGRALSHIPVEERARQLVLLAKECWRANLNREHLG